MMIMLKYLITLDRIKQKRRADAIEYQAKLKAEIKQQVEAIEKKQDDIDLESNVSDEFSEDMTCGQKLLYHL